MISAEQEQFLKSVYDAAVKSGHIFPKMAACEAALESGWGNSSLAKKANNLFGRKVWTAAIDTIIIPTKEFLKGKWVTVDAIWKKFPTFAECLEDRMDILKNDDRYKRAIGATTPEEYIMEVSKVWSTDPNRGKTVLSIYNAHSDILK